MSAGLIRVMRETLPYIWWKYNLQPLPQDHLVHETVDGVWRAVHVEIYLAEQEWRLYLLKHLDSMSTDQRSFARYTLYACYRKFRQIKNPFDRYLQILALVAHFALYIYEKKEMMHAVHVVDKILQRFITKVMSGLKVHQDFWANFVNHIIRKGYLQHHLTIDRMVREGRSKGDILRAIAEESTISQLNRRCLDVLGRIEAEEINDCRLVNKILRAFDHMVYQPEAPKEKDPDYLYSLAEKYDVASRLSDDLKKVSQKLFGLESLLKLANTDLEFKSTFKRGMLEAPFTEEVPKRFLLDYLNNMSKLL